MQKISLVMLYLHYAFLLQNFLCVLQELASYTQCESGVSVS